MTTSTTEPTNKLKNILIRTGAALFWLCVCLSLFLCALTLEDGRVRLYLILAQGTGGTLYLLLLSPAVRLGLGFLLRIPAIPLRIIRTSFRRSSS